MANVNKILSKLNEATTAISSVKGIASKIFGTGYNVNVSEYEKESELERERMAIRSKELKSRNVGLNMIPRTLAKENPTGVSAELVYPRDTLLDNYIHFSILPRKKRFVEIDGEKKDNLLSDKGVEIYIYVPNVANNSPTVSYKTQDFGNVARSLIDGGGLFSGDVLKGLGAEVSEGLQKMVNAVALSTINFREQQIFNPQQEIMFDGMSFRTFDMSFQFRPNSKEEAQVINDMIWTFKTAMLPDTFSGEKGGTDFSENYFNVPNGVEISWEGDISKKLDGFLPSFITGCNVKYNNGGKMETFEDGQPLIIDMDLSFQEGVLLTQSNYQSISPLGTGTAKISNPSLEDGE